VDTAPAGGVTRTLRWVRSRPDIDLLDAPGVAAATADDQRSACCWPLRHIGRAALITRGRCGRPSCAFLLDTA